MALRERLINRVFEISPIRQARDTAVTRALESYQERVQEVWQRNEAIYQEKIDRAWEAGYADGNDESPSGDLRSYGYKTIASGNQRRTVENREQAIDTATKLAEANIIANRLLEMKRDNIVGDDVQPHTDDDELADIFKELWKREDMPRFISEMGYQFPLFGSQCLPVTVRKSDGRIEIGYIDPANIADVWTHPENVRKRIAVELKETTAGAGKKVFRIVRPDEDYVEGDRVVPARHEGKLVTAEQATIAPWERAKLKDCGLTEYSGSVLFERYNALTNDPMGASSLGNAADYLDQADGILFALGDREAFADFFAFDVTIDGDDTAVKKTRKRIANNPPKRGSVNVHNQSEAWDMFNPDLKQPGSIESFRAFLGSILGGKGFPVHWYGFGDDANRATAAAQGTPTAKSLSHEQGIIKGFVVLLLNFVADQAEIAGHWTRPDDITIDAVFPEVSVKDTVAIMGQLVQFAAALIQLMAENLIRRDTAVRALAKIMAEIGVDFDPELEMEEMGEETAVKDEGDMAQRNGKLVGMLDQLSKNGKVNANP